MAKPLSRRHQKSLVQTFREVVLGERKLSPEEELLMTKARKEHKWLGHRNAYISVIGCLTLLNVYLDIQGVVDDIYVVIPAAMWGMGFGIHYLNFRSWLSRNKRSIELAELAVGLREPEPVVVKPAAKTQVGTVTVTEPRWVRLLGDAEVSLERALTTLSRVSGGKDVASQLSKSHQQLSELAEGATQIADTLREISPDGRASLVKALEALDERMMKTTDPTLTEAFHANRALLKTRLAKYESLELEAERMFLTAEGFVLATDNVRLEATSMHADKSASLKASLKSPVSRLSDEIELMRKVQVELAHL